MPAQPVNRGKHLVIAVAIAGSFALAGCAAGAASDAVVSQQPTAPPPSTAPGIPVAPAQTAPAAPAPPPPASPAAPAPTTASASAKASAKAKAKAPVTTSSPAKSAAKATKKPPASMPAAAAPARIDPRLTVSKTTGLDPAGATVTVTGSGFDTSKGIYVAFCVKPAEGVLPSPCGGGADTSGNTGASQWVSSNPPPYGKNLAVPYGPGGTFTVTVTLSKMIGSVDCSVTRCVVAARTDHTRTSDRSQDVLVPITFRSS